jgi:predicted ATPase
MHTRSSVQALPLPLTSFVGRRRELTALTDLTRRPDVRLISVVGVGGCGKTRLALEVAHHLAAEFAEGAAFVDLAPLKETELVRDAIAHALNVRPEGSDVAQARLAEAIGTREVLVLIDNFEHVLPATSVITDLLSSCPRLVFIVTSRAVLHAPGENVFELLPFDVPQEDARTTSKVGK